MKIKDLKSKMRNYGKNPPFDYCIIDNFLDIKLARKLENEFLKYSSTEWHSYKNLLEDKKTLNNWNIFPEETYKLFSYLNSKKFVDELSNIIHSNLYSDSGLHGGGWHIHSNGGNLNPHLDYSIHPKLKLQRKLNLIIYLSSNMKKVHGGHLGLWSSDSNGEISGLKKTIVPKFNRAIIFDTTQNSWHGLVSKLNLKKDQYRKSIAVYYLTKPSKNANERMRALFTPRINQKNNKKINHLIKKRSGVLTSKEVYRTK